MAGPLYVRSTRALSLPEVAEPLHGALATHAARHQLELGSPLVWLTRSENPPATGFLAKLLGRRTNSVDPDPWHEQLILLHPTHLLIGVHGPKRGTSVLDLALSLASVQRGHAGAGLQGMPSDDGFQLDGFPGAVGRPGTYFFGLGSEPAADECFQAIEHAVRAAKSGRDPLFAAEEQLARRRTPP